MFFKNNFVICLVFTYPLMCTLPLIYERWMYILSFDCLKKTINTYLRLEDLVVFRGNLVFKYVFYVFFETNLMIIFFVNEKSLQSPFKAGFSVHNYHLNLCVQVENSKEILCSWKSDIKCGHLRFTNMVVYKKVVNC